MADSIAFDSGDMNKTFNRLIDTLERLDKTMVKVAGSTSVLGRAFGDTDQFRAYAKALEGVEDKAVTAFVNIAKATGELLRAMNRTSKNTTGSLGFVVQGLKKFTEDLDSIKAVDTSRLEIFFKNFEQILLKTKSLPPVQEDILKSINSIGTMVNALAGISRDLVDGDVIGQNLSTIGDELRRFISQINDPDSGLKTISPEMIKSLNSIGAILRAIRRIATEELPEGKEFSSRITSFAGAIREFSSLLTGTAAGGLNTAKMEEASNGIRKTINAMSGIASVAVRISSSNFDTAKTTAFATSIGTIFDSILALQNKINATLPQGGSQVEQTAAMKLMVNQFKAVGLVIKSLQKLTETDFSKINIPESFYQQTERLFRFLSGTETLRDVKAVKDPPERNVTGIKKWLSSAVDIGKAINTYIGDKNIGGRSASESTARLTAMSKTFSQLGNGLSSLNVAIQGVKNEAGGFKTAPVDVKQIGKTFFELGKTLKIGAFILNLIPGGEGLDAMSKNFQRLGIGLSGIMKAVSQINVQGNADENIKSIGVVLFKLGAIVKAAGFIFRFSGDKNTEGFTSTISAIATAVKNLAGLTKIDKGTLKGLNLSAVVSVFERIFIAMRHLPKGKISDAGPVLVAVTDLVKSSASIGKVDADKFKELPQLAEYAALAVERLNRVKIGNPQQAQAIAAQVSAMAKISGGNGPIAQAGGRMAQTIERSFMQLPLSIGGIFDDIVREARILFARKFIETVAYAVSQSITNFTGLKLKISGFLKDVGTDIREFGERMTDFGRTILQSFSLETLFRSNQFNIAAEFEAISSRLTAQLTTVEGGPSIQDQLAEAQEFADYIGIQYPLSANQALEAILDLKKAGQELPDIRNILPSAADLAALTEANDLELATDILIGATQGFDEFAEGVVGSFDNVSTAADLIVAAADVSTASIEELTEGLENVGPAANQMGLTFEDTVAALAVLNDGMIEGADAGTALRGVLSALIRPQTQEELARLGIAVSDANGNIRNLDDIFKDLRARYTELGFSQTQVNESLAQMFDTYSRSAATVLLVNDGFEDTITEMNGVASAADKARQQIDNLKGDMEQLGGSVDTLFKNVLLPSLQRFFRPLVQGALLFVNTMLMLPPIFTETASTIIFITAAVGTFTGSLLVLSGIVAQFGGAILALVGTIGTLVFSGGLFQLVAGMAAFGASLLVALPVIFAIIGALTALSYVVTRAFKSVEDNLEGAGDAFMSFKETIGEAVEEARRIISLFFTGIDQAFGAMGGGSIARQVAQFFNDVTKSIQGFIQFMRGVGTRQVSEFIVANRQVFENLIQGAALIKDAITSILTSTASLEDSFGMLQRGLSHISIGILSAIQSAFGVDFQSAIDGFQTSLASGIRGLVGSVSTILRNAVIEHQAGIREVLLFFVDMINPLKTLENIFRFTGVSSVADFFGSISEQLRNAVGGVFDVIVQLIQGRNIRDILTSTLGDVAAPLLRFVDAISEVAITIGNIFTTIFDSFGLQGDVNVAGQLNNVQDAILGFVDLVSSSLRGFNEDILQPFLERLPRIILGIRDVFDTLMRIAQPVMSVLLSLSDVVRRTFFDIIDLLTGQLDIVAFGENILNNLIHFGETLRRALGNILLNVGTEFGNTFLQDIGEAIRDGDWAYIAGVFIGGLANVFNAVFSFIYDQSRRLFGALSQVDPKQVFTIFKNGLIAVVSAVAQIFGQLVTGFFDALGMSISSESITGFIAPFFGAVMGEMNRFVGNVLQLVGTLLIGISAIPELIANGIRALVDEGSRQLNHLLRDFGILGQALTLVVSVVGRLIAFYIDALGSVIGAFGAVIKIAGKVIVMLSDLFAALFNIFIQPILFVIREIGKFIFGNMVSQVFILIAAIGALGTVISPVIAGIAALALVVDAVGQALIAMADGDVIDGIFRLFGRLVESLLNLFGMSNLLPLWESVWSNAEAIVRFYIGRLWEWLQSVWDGIVLFLEDLRFRVQEATGIELGQDAFFNVQDAFAEAGTLSANEFFGALNAGLEDPNAREAVARAIRLNSDVLVEQFRDATQDYIDTMAEFAATENPTEAMIQNANDVAVGFEQGVLALAVSNSLDDALAEIQDLDVTQRIFDVLSNEFISGDINTAQFSDTMDEYFAALIRNGFFGTATQRELSDFRDTLNSLLEQQIITQEQFDFAVMQIPAEVNESYERTAFNLDAINASIKQEFLTNTEELRASFETLRAAVDDGSISQEDYLNSVDETSDAIIDQIDAIHDNRMEMLRQARDIGAITEKEFEERVRLLEEETAVLANQERSASIERLMEDFNAGRITAEQYATAIADVSAANVELQNSMVLEEELRRLNEEFANTQDIEAYTAAVDELTRNIDNANRAGQVFEPGFIPTEKETGLTTDVGGLLEEEGMQFGEGTEQAAEEAQQNAEEIARIQEQIAEANEDFAIDQKRQMEDDVQAVREKEEDIAKIQKEAAAEEAEREAEFALETSRRMEDFQKKLRDIYMNASDDLEDAVSERDAAAALSAMEARDKELMATQEEFTLEEKRRQEDRMLERKNEALKRAERLADAQKELQDLIAKQMIERQRRLEDHQRRLQEMNAELLAKQAAFQIGSQQNLSYAQQTVQTTNAMFGGILGAAAAAAAAISALVARMRQVSAQAGSFAGTNIGTPMNTAPGGSTTGGQGGQATSGFMAAVGNAITAVNSYTGSTAYGGNQAAYPSFDVGGMITRTGMAKVHEGEAILNQRQQRMWNRGGNGMNISVDLSGMQLNGLATDNPSEMLAAIEERVVGGITKVIQQHNLGKQGI